MNKAQLIILVLVLHFISDFNLQIGAKLHEMKQKAWWRRMFKEYGIIDHKKYDDDWSAAMWIHSFVWASVTFSPLAWIYGDRASIYVLIILNMVIHAFIDNANANLMSINLWQDQLMHLGQIGCTLLYFYIGLQV